MKAELYKRLFKAIYTEERLQKNLNILYLIAAEMKQDWLHCLKANGIIHSWFLIFLASS